MFKTNALSHSVRKVALAASATTLLALSPLALANEVVALKHALYGAGYDIENVSSELDDSTRAELESFQRDQGLDPSGVLDEPTERALGLISVQQAAGTTPQSAGNASSPAESTTAPQAEQAVADEPVAEEEEEDEGWSLW